MASIIGTSVNEKLEETGMKEKISNIANKASETGKVVGSSIYSTTHNLVEKGSESISHV